MTCSICAITRCCNVKDRLAKIEGVGDVQLFGSGDYAMRIWLDPQKIAERGLTADDVVNAVRQQNIQVAAGVINGPPYGKTSELQLPINVEGRLSDRRKNFDNIVVKRDRRSGHTAGRCRARGDRRVAIRRCARCSTTRRRSRSRSSRRPAPTRSDIRTGPRHMEELKQNFPQGLDYHRLRPDRVRAGFHHEAVVHTLLEAMLPGGAGGDPVPADLARVDHSAAGGAGFDRRDLRGDVSVRLFINALSLFGLVLAIGIVVDDAIVVVENVERNIEAGLSPREATLQAMREVTVRSSPSRWCCARCSCRSPSSAVDRRVLSPVRPDHRLLDRHFGVQFADPVAALAAALLRAHDAPKDASRVAWTRCSARSSAASTACSAPSAPRPRRAAGS